MTVSNNQEVHTSHQQSGCSSPCGSQSIKSQPIPTLELTHISNSPPGAPSSPLAPPFSPISAEEDENHPPICIPTQKAMNHFQLP